MLRDRVIWYSFYNFYNFYFFFFAKRLPLPFLSLSRAIISFLTEEVEILFGPAVPVCFS